MAKNGRTIDEYQLRDGVVLLVEMLDKPIVTPRERKPKEETKFSLTYKVRDHNQEEGVEQLSSKLELPKNLKVKQLKKLILDELGMGAGGANLKVYIGENEVEDEGLQVKDL